jgi:hypothetical protein
VINAALIGHLRSPAQPVTLNEVRQPQLRHTNADVLSTLSSETNAGAAVNPSELASTSNPEMTKVSDG